MFLSNREIAVLFWLVALIILGLSNLAIRTSVKHLLHTLCQRIILIVLGVAAIYITVCVSILASVNAWTFANLKTTVLWSLGFAFISIVNISRVEEDPAYFKTVLKEMFSLIVLITFVMDTYTLNLITEFILFPLVSFITLMYAFSENKPEYSVVNKLMGNLLVIVGLLYMGHATIEAIEDFKGLATIDNARDFLVPIFLSLLFMPFLYGLHIYQVYERVFSSLPWSIKDEKLRRYAQRRSLYTFGVNVDFLKRWKRLVSLDTPTTREELNRTFSEIKMVYEREKNPPEIDPQEGWSPYRARLFLSQEGVIYEDYHRSYDKWISSSRHIKIDGKYSLNNIISYIEGSELIANELTLQLNVLHATESECADAEELLYKLITKLLHAAVSSAEAEAFLSRSDRNSYQRQIDQFSISMEKEDLRKDDHLTYEVTFSIKCGRAREVSSSANF